jgi:acyl carrier protein
MGSPYLDVESRQWMEVTNSYTVREHIRHFIVENYLFGTGVFDDNTSLLEEGIIDSTGVLGLVMFVEESFGVAVADEDVVPENFDTVSGLAAYVESKRSPCPQAAAG